MYSNQRRSERRLCYSTLRYATAILFYSIQCYGLLLLLPLLLLQLIHTRKFAGVPEGRAARHAPERKHKSRVGEGQSGDAARAPRASPRVARRAATRVNLRMRAADRSLAVNLRKRARANKRGAKHVTKKRRTPEAYKSTFSLISLFYSMLWTTAAIKRVDY